MKDSIDNRIKQILRWQRNFFRRMRLRKLDVESRLKNEAFVLSKTSKALLIAVNEGWGDSLFVAGLACRLKQIGFSSVGVVTAQHLLHHFNHPVFDFKTTLDSPEKCTDFSPDVIIDLTFVGNAFYRERLLLIRKLNCVAVTTSELCAGLNLFDKAVLFRSKAHISERFALILQLFTHKEEKPVLPSVYMSDADKLCAYRYLLSISPDIRSQRVAYINAEASKQEHFLSEEQVRMMAVKLLELGFHFVIVNGRGLEEKIGNNIYALPKFSFNTFAAFISQMSLVVTPDSSPSHLASIFNVPAFVIFPKNARDFFKEYSLDETWGPVGSHSCIFAKNDPFLRIGASGYANRKMEPIRDYNPQELTTALNHFILDLYG